jgi:glycerol kinase
MLSPHYGASKMRWCLEHVEAVRAAAVDGRLRMAPLASYLLRSLLDEHPEFVDPANASRTLLWSPHTRDWSAELLALFDIPRSVLPTCVPSRHAFGSLPFATRLIPLQLCTGDQNAAVFADGHTANDAAYLNVGTGAFLLATLDRDPSDSMPLLRSVLYWDERELCYALEGTVNGAGSALDWLREREHVDTHTIARELSRIDEHTSIPIFINGVSGVGSPYWRAHQRTYFDGSGDARTLVVAVLESIAFLIAENFELMRARVPLTRIRATGGLIESEYLCRCVASLGRVPVERSRQQEATARGLAYLCAGMPQRWPEATVETFPPERMPALETRQARWREIMSSG